VANKLDLYPDSNDRQVSELHVRSLMQSPVGAHIRYHEISALKNIGVTEIFKEMASKIQEQREYYYRTKVISSNKSFWS